MSLDTKWRPLTYSDVLGQLETIQILKQYVASGAGFHQSYLFAGPFGSGKTTLARVLARALLCTSPVNGDPCDQCMSCKSILEGGSSPDFFEIDAATNSGKDSVRKIVDEIQYSTFSGKRRLYLLDEAHRLSTDALDALLKPLEDNYPGTQDKLLVCIFCTTEPERMRNTILSRCAPAFVIRPVSPSQVGDRLEMVCKKEGIPYERQALDLIGEITECHIRDALKAVEGVSMLGAVDGSNVARYLHLDYADTVLAVLSTLKTDLPAAITKAEGLLKSMSPITLYEKLSDMAMLAYRASLGPVPIPTYLDREAVETLGRERGGDLLDYVEKLSSRPGRPTSAMLLCDLSQLHRGIRLVAVDSSKLGQSSPAIPKVEGTVKTPHAEKPVVVDGVFVDDRAVNARSSEQVELRHSSTTPPASLTPLDFFQLVKRRVLELDQPSADGQAGRDNMGHTGTHEGG
jgi:DNA polymerase III subunit gamma/tau